MPPNARDGSVSPGTAKKERSTSMIAGKFPQVFQKIWKIIFVTGKSFSEALIFASTNTQYDYILFIELRVHYMKISSSEHAQNMCT